MPIYEYRCEKGHTFEAFQSMSEDALGECEVCGATASRLLSAPAIHYKGSGFYTTDYARKGAKKAAGGEGEKPSGGSESKSSESKGAEKSPGSSGEATKASSAKAGSAD